MGFLNYDQLWVDLAVIIHLVWAPSIHFGFKCYYQGSEDIFYSYSHHNKKGIISEGSSSINGHDNTSNKNNSFVHLPLQVVL